MNMFIKNIFRVCTAVSLTPLFIRASVGTSVRYPLPLRRWNVQMERYYFYLVKGNKRMIPYKWGTKRELRRGGEGKAGKHGALLAGLCRFHPGA